MLTISLASKVEHAEDEIYSLLIDPDNHEYFRAIKVMYAFFV